MSVQQIPVHLLVLELSKKGIRLWLENGELRFSAPPGVFTADLKQQVKSQREQVIQFLHQSSLSDSAIPARNKDDKTLASLGQRSLFLAQQAIGEAASYNLVSSGISHEALDIDLLQQTMTVLNTRYEVLRTTFSNNDDQLLQVINEPAPAKLHVHDFSAQPMEQAEQALSQVIAGEEQFAFNLNSGELVRYSLVKLADEKFVILLNIHHIVCDASSMSILIQALGETYEALKNGETDSAVVDGSPAAHQYADFALWQIAQFESGVYDQQIAYWAKQLKNLPGALEVSTDFSRSAKNSGAGKSLSFSLGNSNTKALEALARAQGCTLFSLLLTLYKVFLHRYSKATDIFVGSPFSGRTHPDTEQQIGYFVNTVVLRNHIDPQHTFSDFLQQVQQSVVAAQANQDVPFQTVTESLQSQSSNQSQSASGNTGGLYQVSFVLNNTDAALKAMEGQEQRYTDNDGVISHAAKDELSLQFTFEKDGLNGKFTYKTSLFLDSTAQAYIAQFQLYVAEVLANPNIVLGDLLAQLPQSQRDVLNALAPQFPVDDLAPKASASKEYKNEFIQDLIAQSCEQNAQRIALEMHQGDQVISLTYAQLEQRANLLASQLIADGVTFDMPVAVSMARSIDQVIAFYGILKAGAVFLPIDIALPADRREYMLNTAGAKHIITDASAKQLYQPGTPAQSEYRLYDIAQWQNTPQNKAGEEPVQPENLHSNSTAYIIFTSGTTGLPKGVQVSHKGLANLARQQADFFQIDNQSKVFQFASISFDAWVSEVIKTLFAGATLLVLPQDDIVPGPALAEKLGGAKVTHFTMTPSALAVLPKAPLKHLKTVVTAGEACAKEIALDWAQHCRFVNAYGPSEATVCASYYAFEGDELNQPYTTLSIGSAMGKVNLYVLDERMRLVPLGVPGMLYIGGEGLARGYINRPALTASSFVPNPFSTQENGRGERLYRTGDIVKVRANGTLEYLGRDDSQIKLRGFRIELDEIAQAMHSYPAITNAVAVVKTNPAGAEELVAYFTSDTDTDVQALAALLKTKLPHYMIPRVFEALPEMPVNVNGKIDTQALPAPQWQKQAQQQLAESTPKTPTQKALHGIFMTILSTRESDLLGMGDSFFDMGGNSLLVGQLSAAIKDTLSADISARLIFENQTIADIAALIDSGRYALTTKTQKIEVASKAQRRQLSFMQQRLWFLSQLEEASSTYHIPAILQFNGECHVPALKQALLDIQQRHDVLRTAFVDIDGVPAARLSRKALLDMPVVDISNEPETLQFCLGNSIDFPFDLTQGPLIRATLFKVSDQQHVLCVVLHHIISDGWSVGILVNEINTLYQHYASAAEQGLAFNSPSLSSPLPALPVQYGDFAHWQRNINAASQQEAHLDFWLDTLRDVPTVINLPTDKIRPPKQSFNGATHVSRLSLNTRQAITQLGNSKGASVFMTLLSVFYVILNRYSQQNDVLVGTPVANRVRPELEALIGFFVNTIVLRQNVSADLTFEQLLQATKDVCLAAYEHQDYPFEALVEKINPERSQSHSPLFQVMFSQENTTAFDQQKDNLEVSALRDTSNTAKFDLSLSFMETDAGIDLYWEYCTDLFLPETIAAIADNFNVACEQALLNPQQHVNRMDIMTPAERDILLNQWNNNALPLPDAQSIAQLISQQAAQTPNAIALEYAPSTATTSQEQTENLQHSYQAFEQQSNQLAHYLIAQGVVKGSRVAVCMTRSDKLVIALLAVMKAGAAYVPVDPVYPQNRIEYMIEDSGAQLVLTESALADTTLAKIAQMNAAAQQQPKLLALDSEPTQQHIEQLSQNALETAPEIAPQKHDLAYIIYTSGSTGKPKGVCIEQGSALAMLTWAVTTFGDKNNAGFDLKSMLASTSMCFDLSVFEFFAPLCCGGKTVVIDSILQLIDTQPDALDVTFVNTVPSALNELVALNVLPANTQVVTVAGEALTRSTVDEFYQAYPELRLVNAYGPSEDTTYSTVAFVPNSAKPLSEPQQQITIGVPLNNTQAYVLDAYLQPVPKGVRGELYLAGEGVARGYWNRPDLTAERFVPNPFSNQPGARMYKTSDIVSYLGNGELRFFGRDDRQVKIRGYRIEMGEIEQALRDHPDVQQAIVLPKNTDAGQILVAWYVLNEPANPQTEQPTSQDSLKAHLGNALPEYFIPQHFVAIDEVPLLPNGKTNFSQLPDPLISNINTAEQVQASTVTEKKLLAIWCDLLQRTDLGITSNFFSLGGHSLLGIRMVSRIEKTFRRRVPLNVIFQKPTVQALSAFIDTLTEENAQETLPALISDTDNQYQPFPLTPVQQAYWLGRQANMTLGNIGTHTYQEIDFNEFNVDDFSRVINQLIQRHAMMRMVIDDKGQQRVLANVGPYDVDFQDLSSLSESDKQQALLARRNTLSHHVFDPAVWPLFNIKVSKIAADKYRLYWSFDGLLLDGASQQILSRELLILISDANAELPPINATFRDYVMTEERIKSLSVYEKARNYWLERVGDLPLAAELPLAKDPSHVTNPVFARRKFVLPPEQWQVLKNKASANNITPTVMMLSLFSEILNLWSKTNHFCLNLTLFNRLPLHEQVNDLIGDFTSLTLLEILREEGLSFRSFAQTVQNQLWEDLEHRIFGGIEVQRAMRNFHGSGTSVEIPVVFTSLLGFEADSKSSPAPEDTSEATPESSGSDHKEAMLEGYGISQTSQVWLDHQVGEVNGALEVNWDAVAELFPDGLLDAMFNTYRATLDALAQDDSAWEKRILVQLPTEQKQLLDGVNNEALNSEALNSEAQTSTNIDKSTLGNVLLHSRFDTQAEQNPKAIALIQGVANANGQAPVSLTYGQLNGAANNLANRIGDRADKPDSLVAVVMEKGWEQVVAVLAILKANGAYLPVDASAPPQRIQQLLESGNVEVVITQPAFSDQDWAQSVRVETIDPSWLVELTEDSASTKLQVPSRRQPSDLAYVIFTSGSTGKPKGVVIPHHGAMTTIDAINKIWSVTSNDKVLGLSALNFDLSVYDIFGVLAVGGTLVLPEPGLSRDTQHWCRLMDSHQITLWNTVPALMQLYVDALEVNHQHAPDSLRHVMMSGDWIPLTLPDRIKQIAKTDIQVTSLGGATEASIWSIYYPIDMTSDTAIDESWKSIPYGKALPNQSMLVLKDDHQTCPLWVEGDIYIGGEGVAYGYWQDKTRTDAAFMHHKLSGEYIYRTGDKGRYLPDGNIEFLGREDFQVKVQGYRIELGEIESHLVRHEFVSTAVVVATAANSANNNSDNKTLVAYVVPEQFDAQVNAASEQEEGVLQDAQERQAFKMKRAGHLSGEDLLPEQVTQQDEVSAQEYLLPGAERVLSSLTVAVAANQGGFVSGTVKSDVPNSDTLPVDTVAEVLRSVRPIAVEGSALSKYFYASTGSLNAVQLYIEVPENATHSDSNDSNGSKDGKDSETPTAGVYYYDPIAHKLVRTAASSGAPGNADWQIHYVVDHSAICPIYGKLGETLGEIEAGYIHQLLASVAATHSLQLTPFNSANASGVNPPVLNASQHCVFSARLSVIRKEADSLPGIEPDSSQPTAPASHIALTPAHLPASRTFTLHERQSYRRYQDAMVSQTQLSGLLTQLANTARQSANECQSSGANNSLATMDVLVYVKPERVEQIEGGLYRFHSVSQSLEKVAQDQDLRMDLCHIGVNEPIFDAAAFGIYLLADPVLLIQEQQEQQEQQHDTGNQWIYRRAGEIGQAMLAYGPEVNVGICPIGFVNQEAIAHALEQKQIIHSFLGGVISDEQKAHWDQDIPTAKSLEQRLTEQLESVLPQYMVPKTIMLLDALPLTANGKIDRKALPDPVQQSSNGETEYMPPQNAMQAKLVEMWEEVLLSPNIGIRDNFFSLGGDSLTAIQLIGRIQQFSGSTVGLHQLFENPDIEQLSVIVAQSQPNESDAQQTGSPDNQSNKQEEWPELIHDAVNKAEPFPLTDVQHAYWLGRSGAFELGNVSCHSYLEIDLNSYDHQVFQSGFNKLIQHHDMLRMVVNRDGLQQILDEDRYYTIDYQDISMLNEQEIQQQLMTRRDRMSHQVHDPAHWPLFELSVLKHSENDIRMFWSIDLLLVDGSSQNMLSRDFQTISVDANAQFQKPAITFRDYVLGERKLRETAVYQRARDYWQNRLATLPSGPQLPLAKEPGDIDVPRFKRHEFILSSNQWQQIKARAKHHGVTSSVLLATAFSDVLARWSQQDSFCLNLTLFNRQPLHQDVFNIIGDFTSLTLLQVDKDRSQNFAQRCRETQRQLWEDMEHKMFGGIEVLRLMRQSDPNVTMPVVFTSMLDTEGPQAKKAAEAAMENVGSDDDSQKDVRGFGISQTSQVWLDHQVNERDGKLVINWDVIEELFPQGMIEDMFETYQQHVKSLLDEAAWLQTEQHLFPESQREQRKQINSVVHPCQSKLLHEGFEKQVLATPDNPAIITASAHINPGKNQGQINYSQLNNGANVLAAQLQRLDAKPNELVAIVMRKGWEQIAAALGILKSGAAYLPIDADMPSTRIVAILEQAQVRTLVIQPEQANKPWTAGRNVCAMLESSLTDTTQSNPVAVQSLHDLAYVIFTSGSTGTPKGVMIDHYGAIHTVEVMNHQYEVTENDRVLGLSSMSFDLSVYDVFGLLSAGGAIVLPDADKGKDPAHWHALAQQHQLTLWNTVPALMQMWVDYVEETGDKLPDSLRHVLMSGDYIPVTLPDRIKALGSVEPAIKVDSLGGATEASIWSVFYPIHVVESHWKTIPYGKPLANQSYHVLKPDFSDCPDWVQGELYIGGSGVAKGYWRDEEKTNSHFMRHPQTGEALYRTGDMGRYFPDGNIEFLGRIDNQVKVQGHRIELGEIDTAILKHPAVDKVTTLALENEALEKGRGNKQLVSYIVPDFPEASFTGEKLIQDPMERAVFKMKRAGLRQFSPSVQSVVLPIPTQLQQPDQAWLSQRWTANLWQQTAVANPQVLVSLAAIGSLLASIKAYQPEKSGNQTGLPKYFYASTGSLNAVQCYLSVPGNTVLGLDAGYYYYAPEKHQLIRTCAYPQANGGTENGGQSGQPQGHDASLNSLSLHLVVNTNAIEPVYGDLAARLSLIESGYVAELLLATAASLNMAMWQPDSANGNGLADYTAALESPDLKQVFGIQDNDLLALSFNVAMQTDSAPETNTDTATPSNTKALGLIERQSYREFLQENLVSEDQFYGFLNALWACDVTAEIGVYLFVKPNRIEGVAGGYYRWQPVQQSLSLLSHSQVSVEEAADNTFARYLGVNETMQTQSAFALYLVSDTGIQNGLTDSQTLLQTGALGQRLLSHCSEFEVGLCPVGDFMEGDLQQDLGLRAEQVILHSFVGGGISQAQTQSWGTESADKAYSLEGSITEFAAGKLPSYMVPTLIMFLDALPLTANGKIDRKALPKPQFSADGNTTSAPPQTPLQQQIAEIWQEVLGTSGHSSEPGTAISIDDNFTQLGGNSLSIVQVQTRLRNRFNVELDLRLFYENQTVRELEPVVARLLEKQALLEKQSPQQEQQAQSQSATGNANLQPGQSGEPAQDSLYSLSAIKAASAREQAKRKLASLTPEQKQALLAKAQQKKTQKNTQKNTQNKSQENSQNRDTKKEQEHE